MSEKDVEQGCTCTGECECCTCKEKEVSANETLNEKMCNHIMDRFMRVY